MKSLVFERLVSLRAPRAAVWARLRDTDRINRATGTKPLVVTPIEAGATRFLICTRNSGFKLEYEEPPFQWVEGEMLALERHNRGGPVKEVRIRYTLEDRAEGGTDLTMRLSILPRFHLMVPIAWVVGRQTVATVARYFASFDATIETGARPPLPPPVFDRARADRLAAPLTATFGEDLPRKLVAFLVDCTDLEAQTIRPFELADSWGADGDTTLRLFLAATKEGLLELRWAVLCPSCSQASETLPTLRDLTDDFGHCHACDIRFGLELDRAVEAVFEPHASVRIIERRPLCIAGPMLTPHVVAQAFGEEGQPLTLRAPEGAGRYRVFVRGGAAVPVDVVAGAPDQVTITVTGDDPTPTATTVAPRGFITVAFDGGGARHAKLERVEWSFRAATAHHVSMLPEFRAQFGSEALREGMALRVARTTILFSDLCGSTALYSKVGDAAAFGVVSDCLAYGRVIVERHHGVVIKTMGDAIMAAFADPRDAVGAGAAMIAEWNVHRDKNALLRELDLKVGVFGGPCTVVSANGVLDYFGQTVNSAARVQHLAGPRELVIADALAREIDAPPGTFYGEPFGARVKGIEEELVLRRCRVGDLPPAG